MPRNSELIGDVRYSFTAGLRPWDGDPEQYYFTIVGNIFVFVGDNEHPDEEAQAGEIHLTVIKAAEAINDHARLDFIFDALDMELIHEALFEDDDTIKVELKIDAPLGDVLIINSIELDPQYARTPVFWQVAETAIATFASVGLVAAYDDTLRSGGRQWSECGFRPAPETRIVYRDNFGIRPDHKAL